MSFNFGTLSTAKPATTNSYLKPYNIYENVTIKSTEIKSGTSAKGNDWKSLNITFGNDEGTYSHSIFWITSDKDFERGSQDMPNGGKRELPSNWERTRDIIAAIGFAFAPEAFTKLQAMASKAKTFDDIALTFKKILDATIDKNPTNMKLIGRNSGGKVYATLPSCTGIAQAKTEDRATANNVKVGEWYTWMISPFGNNLSFTDYEQKQADTYRNAKPTPSENLDSLTDISNQSTTPSVATEDEFNFDSLL